MAFDINLAHAWTQLLDDLAKIDAWLLYYRCYNG